MSARSWSASTTGPCAPRAASKASRSAPGAPSASRSCRSRSLMRQWPSNSACASAPSPVATKVTRAACK
eukprot:11253914-Alexandrium_andersonii.AAC.1